MEKIIAKLRADWPIVAEARRASAEWTDEDERDIGLAIKAAIEAKDLSTLALWSHWLSDLATGVTYFRLVVRAAESAIRLQVAANKAKQAGVPK